MEGLLILIYLLVFSWLVTKTSFFIDSGLSRKFLWIYFLGSSLLGMAHLWFAYRNFPGHGDMWRFFGEGVKLKQLLLTDWNGFLQEMKVDVLEKGLFTSGSLLVRIQYQFMNFLYMVFNLFSFSHNYVNIIIFSYLLMFGKIAWFRTCLKYLPGQLLPALVFLLLPGLLFWTGPIHKEGLILLFTGLVAWNLSQKGINRWMVVAPALAIVFLARSYVLGLLVLAVLFKYIAQLKPVIRLIGLFSLIAVAGLLSLTGLIHPLLKEVVERQQEFLGLSGNTQLDPISLEPTAGSFLRNLPLALKNGLLIPYPFQFNLLYTFFSLEAWLVLFICIASLFQYGRWNSFMVFCLVFALAGVLVTGYTIPFAGAVVRYRSIYLPFLAAPAFYAIQEFKWVIWAENKAACLTNYKF